MLKIHYTRFPVTSRCNLEKDTTQQTQRTFARAFYGLAIRTCRLCCGLVVDLLRGNRQLVTDLLREKWCNGIWP